MIKNDDDEKIFNDPSYRQLKFKDLRVDDIEIILNEIKEIKLDIQRMRDNDIKLIRMVAKVGDYAEKTYRILKK